MIGFVDCQGLAGAFTLAAVQTGEFELQHRVSYHGGFGDALVNDNRGLLPGSWEQDAGGDWDEWEPGQAAFLCGTPPCAGFSSLNTQGEKGAGAKQNKCMYSLIRYASRCVGTDGRRGPEVVAFESVQQAYTKGRSLMHALWDILEDETDQAYELNHVLMSGSSVGAAQMRHRYFAVWSRVPFGVDPPVRKDLPDGRVVTYRDALSGLEGLDLQWARQPYQRPDDSAYGASLRAGDGVSCMETAGGGVVRAAEAAAALGWLPGEFLSETFDRLDHHPEQFKKNRRPGGLRRGTSTYRGLNWPYRVMPDKPGYVLAGSCGRDFAHWSEPRMLTIRELSRLMGYPDEWEWPHKSTVASALLGKCAPVPSCRWLSTWVARSLNGEPGAPGRMIGDGEFLHNSTRAYKDWLD